LNSLIASAIWRGTSAATRAASRNPRQLMLPELPAEMGLLY
jgi:hypothetical protein